MSSFLTAQLVVLAPICFDLSHFVVSTCRLNAVSGCCCPILMLDASIYVVCIRFAVQFLASFSFSVQTAQTDMHVSHSARYPSCRIVQRFASLPWAFSPACLHALTFDCCSLFRLHFVSPNSASQWGQSSSSKSATSWHSLFFSVFYHLLSKSNAVTVR